MDTAQWAQGIGVVKPMESSRPAVLERKTRPQKDQALINCPRCNSTNTKFCYYNNYSLSQPRYFCKTCRRYWTEGGSLRNVPVGGGSRKNKRASASSLSANSTAPSLKKLSSTTDQLTVPVFPSLSTTQSSKIYKNHQDLNLAYPAADLQDYRTLSKFEEVPYASTDHEKSRSENPNSSSATSHQSHLSSIELLKTGIASRGLGSFMGLPASDQPSTMYSDGYSLQDIKPSLNFPLEGFENGYVTRQGMQEGTGARLLFPVEELNKQVPDTTELDQSRSQSEQASGYWNGLLGGGPW